MQNPTAPQEVLYGLQNRIVRICRRKDDGDDLYQEVWIKLLKWEQAYTWTRALFMKTARNLAKDMYRRRRTQHANQFKVFSHHQSSDSDGRTSDPARSLSIARKAISALPDKYRVTIECELATGPMPQSQKAATLGLCLATYSTRLHRAKQMLKEVLGPTCAI